MSERLDVSEAYKFWDVLREDNQLTEIRLIANDGKTASGIFDNVDDMVNAIIPYSNDWNIYYTINRLPDDVSGLPQYKKIIQRPKQTCNDAMITLRDWVVCDLDSKRLSGTNATDDQVQYTKEKANQIYKFLIDNGFNKPVVVFSSNGVHIYIKCAMINNDTNTELCKRFLQALSMLFSDEHTDVDEKVFNSARIMRLPSSYSCKGNKMDDKRPQRLCKFVSIPQDIKANDIEYFKKIANLYPEETIKPSRENNYSVEKFDLDGFILKHGINVTKVENVSGGKKYVLDHCIFNDQHKGKDAVIFQKDSGAIAYVCLHNSCSQYTWRDVRLKFEPNAYEKKDYNNPRQFSPYKYKQSQEVKEQSVEEEKGNVWQCLDEIEDEDRSKIISIPSGILQYDKECCGFDKPSLSVWTGNNGGGKSSLLNQLAINAVDKGFKVAIYSGELRGKKIKRWFLYQASGKTYNKKSQYNDYDYYTPQPIKDKIVSWMKGKLFNYNTKYSHDINQICKEIEALNAKEDIDMVIFDNLSCLDIDSIGDNINEQQKAAIKKVLQLANNLEISVHIVVHPRKSSAYLVKEDISGSKTITDLADNVFAVQRWNLAAQKAANEYLPKERYSEIMISGATNLVEVIKHREFGDAEGHIYKLYFETESKRLKNSIAEHVVYGWQEDAVQSELPIQPYQQIDDSCFTQSDEDCPF